MLIEITTGGKIFVDGKDYQGPTPPERLLAAWLRGEPVPLAHARKAA